jgi:hypothetical protein
MFLSGFEHSPVQSALSEMTQFRTSLVVVLERRYSNRQNDDFS